MLELHFSCLDRYLLSLGSSRWWFIGIQCVHYVESEMNMIETVDNRVV